MFCFGRYVSDVAQTDGYQKPEKLFRSVFTLRLRKLIASYALRCSGIH